MKKYLVLFFSTILILIISRVLIIQYTTKELNNVIFEIENKENNISLKKLNKLKYISTIFFFNKNVRKLKEKIASKFNAQAKYDLALKYYKEYSISIPAHNKEELAYSYFYIARTYYYNGNYHDVNCYIEKTKKILKNRENSFLESNLYYLQSLVFKYSNLQKSKDLCYKALKKIENVKNKTKDEDLLKAFFYKELGKLEVRSNHLQSGISNLKNSLFILYKYKKSEFNDIVECSYRIGLIYSKIGDYVKSEMNFEKALLFIKNNQKFYIPIVDQLSTIKIKLKKDKESKKLINEIVKFYAQKYNVDDKKLFQLIESEKKQNQIQMLKKDKELYLSLCYFLGDLELYAGNLDISLNYCQKGLLFAENIYKNKNEKLAKYYYKVGLIYFKIRNYPKGEFYLEKSLLGREWLNENNLLVKTIDDLANIKFILGKYNDAEKLIREIIFIYSANGDVKINKVKSYIDIYKKIKKTSKK